MSLRSPLVPKWRRRTGAATLVKWQRTDIWWCHFELHSVLQLVGEDTFSSSSMATCPVMSSAELSCFRLLSNVLTGGGAYSFTAADHNAFSGHPSLCAISGGHSQSDEKKLLWQQIEIRRRNYFSPLWWHKSTVQPNSHLSRVKKHKKAWHVFDLLKHCRSPAMKSTKCGILNCTV